MSKDFVGWSMSTPSRFEGEDQIVDLLNQYQVSQEEHELLMMWVYDNKLYRSVRFKKLPIIDRIPEEDMQRILFLCQRFKVADTRSRVIKIK